MSLFFCACCPFTEGAETKSSVEGPLRYLSLYLNLSLQFLTFYVSSGFSLVPELGSHCAHGGMAP